LVLLPVPWDQSLIAAWRPTCVKIPRDLQGHACARERPITSPRDGQRGRHSENPVHGVAVRRSLSKILGRGRQRTLKSGAALLVFTLAGQAAYYYRADLAVQYPGLKPYLVKLCDALQCKVLPPQRPRQIAIEASDLQATDPARPGLIQLTATLRNHAGHDLGYPALDLVLTNTKEHTLARRVFLPKDYLERGKDVASGMPANAEITIRLDLDTGDLSPAGFRLDLLPAPAP